MLELDHLSSRVRSLVVSVADLTHPRAAFIERFVRAGSGTPYGVPLAETKHD